MDWFAAVNIYCERTTAAFWAEPVNALSNLAVLPPVLWVALTARRLGERSPAIWALIVLAALIGVGSFLFHTAATRWAELADTLPIWGFFALYIFVAAERLFGLSLTRRHGAALAAVAVLVLVFLANGEGAARASDATSVAVAEPRNGSAQYLPAVAVAIAFVAGVWWRGHPARLWVTGAALAFALALMLRAYDAAICERFPLGTHFLWHLCNCLTLGLVLQTLLRCRDVARPQAAAARSDTPARLGARSASR